ncbi:MAG: hypothetical protein GX446_18955, partial [Chthonomonadales bacterium]|nr:hypothetical protein [Chthonomonadales bacterium]
WFADGAGKLRPGSGLWAADLTTGRIVPLALHRAEYDDGFRIYRAPSWSADSGRIAFTAVGSLDRSLIGFALADGRSASFERPDRFGASGYGVFAPTGSKLAFAQAIIRGPSAGRVATIRVVEPGGRVAGCVFRVAPSDYARLCPTDASRHGGRPVQPYVAGLRWTPDGERLLFALGPTASDRERVSLWLLSPLQREEPRRLSPDDGYGYFAPYPIGDRYFGAGRCRGGRYEAVLLSRDGRIMEAHPVPSDDWDWRPDGTAVVCSDNARRAAQPAGLTIVRFARVGVSSLR